MARHINADQMIADTEAMKQVCEAIEIDGIIKYIEEHIAADVQEVKHGRWMDGKYFPFTPKKGTQGFQTATCSRCNITQSVNTYREKVMFNYCPYCGAKMDGRGNE